VGGFSLVPVVEPASSPRCDLLGLDCARKRFSETHPPYRPYATHVRTRLFRLPPHPRKELGAAGQLYDRSASAVLPASVSRAFIRLWLELCQIFKGSFVTSQSCHLISKLHRENNLTMYSCLTYGPYNALLTGSAPVGAYEVDACRKLSDALQRQGAKVFAQLPIRMAQLNRYLTPNRIIRIRPMQLKTEDHTLGN
jgi:hypothetical protein